METDLGHWSYKGPDVDVDNMIGFVYCITCGLTNKKYIGKKLLQNKKRRKPLKGRVNARRYKVESDWKTYCGSSPALNEYIAKNGGKDFTFEILSFQPSKLLLAYYETKEIIDRNAVFSNEYYNEVLNCRFRFWKQRA
jgi:hypothetical protein